MNILIDMSSIRAGGGVQQAINFIENIDSFLESGFQKLDISIKKICI